MELHWAVIVFVILLNNVVLNSGAPADSNKSNIADVESTDADINHQRAIADDDDKINDNDEEETDSTSSDDNDSNGNYFTNTMQSTENGKCVNAITVTGKGVKDFWKFPCSAGTMTGYVSEDDVLVANPASVQTYSIYGKNPGELQIIENGKCCIKIYNGKTSVFDSDVLGPTCDAMKKEHLQRLQKWQQWEAETFPPNFPFSNDKNSKPNTLTGGSISQRPNVPPASASSTTGNGNLINTPSTGTTTSTSGSGLSNSFSGADKPSSVTSNNDGTNSGSSSSSSPSSGGYAVGSKPSPPTSNNNGINSGSSSSSPGKPSATGSVGTKPSLSSSVSGNRPSENTILSGSTGVSTSSGTPSIGGSITGNFPNPGSSSSNGFGGTTGIPEILSASGITNGNIPYYEEDPSGDFSFGKPSSNSYLTGSTSLGNPSSNGGSSGNVLLGNPTVSGGVSGNVPVGNPTTSGGITGNKLFGNPSVSGSVSGNVPVGNPTTSGGITGNTFSGNPAVSGSLSGNAPVGNPSPSSGAGGNKIPDKPTLNGGVNGNIIPGISSPSGSVNGFNSGVSSSNGNFGGSTSFSGVPSTGGFLPGSSLYPNGYISGSNFFSGKPPSSASFPSTSVGFGGTTGSSTVPGWRQLFLDTIKRLGNWINQHYPNIAGRDVITNNEN